MKPSEFLKTQQGKWLAVLSALAVLGGLGGYANAGSSAPRPAFEGRVAADGGTWNLVCRSAVSVEVNKGDTLTSLENRFLKKHPIHQPTSSDEPSIPIGAIAQAAAVASGISDHPNDTREGDTVTILGDCEPGDSAP